MRGFGRDENPTAREAGLGELGTIFSLRPTAKYLTGARTIIKVNGKLVGFAFSVSWSITTEAQEIRTIDDPIPYELAPSYVSVSGSIGGFIIPGKSATAELIQSDIANFLTNKYITIEVRDSATDTIIFKTNRAMVIGQQGSVRAENPSELSLTWKAIGWQAETPPAPPSDSDLNNAGSSSGFLDKIKSKFNF